jgi:uridine phosphorylase
MEGDAAVINPVKGKKSPYPGRLALMISSGGDLDMLREHLNVETAHPRLMMSQIHVERASPPGFSLAGPVVGAPYAAMIMEPLIAWGAESFLFWGWCGSLSADVGIGDIILCSGAIIDEGTSPGYHGKSQDMARPCSGVNQRIRRVLNDLDLRFHEGIVWSTDAIYRETKDKIRHFQARGALAVEMEASALFTVARFRGVAAGAILVVSDELASFTWKPGFNDAGFQNNRKAMVEVMKRYVRAFGTPGD